MQSPPKKDERAARDTEVAPRPTPGPVDLSEESVAGEEDPGAALDVNERAPAPRPGPTPPDKGSSS